MTGVDTKVRPAARIAQVAALGAAHRTVSVTTTPTIASVSSTPIVSTAWSPRTPRSTPQPAISTQRPRTLAVPVPPRSRRRRPTIAAPAPAATANAGAARSVIATSPSPSSSRASPTLHARTWCTSMAHRATALRRSRPSKRPGAPDVTVRVASTGVGRSSSCRTGGSRPQPGWRGWRGVRRAWPPPTRWGRGPCVSRR